MATEGNQVGSQIMVDSRQKYGTNDDDERMICLVNQGRLAIG